MIQITCLVSLPWTGATAMSTQAGREAEADLLAHPMAATPTTVTAETARLSAIQRDKLALPGVRAMANSVAPTAASNMLDSKAIRS